jgi:hypothetical protein
MRASSFNGMTKTWLITGAGRGMGVEFARAALAAGHNVAATGRNPDTVRSAVGEHENLLVTALDETMIVEPGFFRTELLQPESTTFGELSIDDYADADADAAMLPFWRSTNGRQAVEGVQGKAQLLLAQVAAHRELSVSLAHEDAKAGA